jgi:hypothetical protein
MRLYINSHWAFSAFTLGIILLTSKYLNTNITWIFNIFSKYKMNLKTKPQRKGELDARKTEKQAGTAGSRAVGSIYAQRASLDHVPWACIEEKETPEEKASEAPECLRAWKLKSLL